MTTKFSMFGRVLEIVKNKGVVSFEELAVEMNIEIQLLSSVCESLHDNGFVLLKYRLAKKYDHSKHNIATIALKNHDKCEVKALELAV